MTLKHTLLLFLLFPILSIYAQDNETILFTIDDTPTYTSEFLRIYNKNLDIVADDDQKEIHNYLDLFINYKLKVKQAYDLGLDTLKPYKKELSSYKRQLMEPYLKDTTVIDSLVKEAYNRSLVELDVSHILVQTNQRPIQIDTLRAYNKIQKAYSKLMSGEQFDIVAKQYSEDPSVKSNNGNLGYFTTFDMVYPFESVAYNAAINEISKPFKTRFGYHILLVHNIRTARGEIEVSHIMLKNDTLNNVQERINTIYAQLINGENFAVLASRASEDRYSAKNGGDLGKFGTGKMVAEFEDVAFSMEEIGSISEPFQTQYGWHIVKLINKFPVEDFEIVKEELTNKVKRGDRASLVSNSIAYKLEKKYKIVVNEDVLSDFTTSEKSDNSKIVLTIEGEVILQKEFVKYLNNRKTTSKLFQSFKKEKILDYYKSHLEETNVEFAQSYQEYKDGLLLFELLQANIWSKSKDSLEIQNYFETHKDDYEKGQQLENIKGTVINDYQEHIEAKWIEELRAKYTIVIHEDVVEFINSQRE